MFFFWKKVEFTWGRKLESSTTLSLILQKYIGHRRPPWNSTYLMFTLNLKKCKMIKDKWWSICVAVPLTNKSGKLKFSVKSIIPMETLAYRYKIACGIQRTIGYFLQALLKVKSLSCVRLFVTPWTGACQVPPSMEFCREEYWSGLPFPSPGDLPDPGIKPRSPAFQADTTIWATWEACRLYCTLVKIYWAHL